MKPETEIDETGSFGEPEEKPAPFWKRSVWGISGKALQILKSSRNLLHVMFTLILSAVTAGQDFTAQADVQPMHTTRQAL